MRKRVGVLVLLLGAAFAASACELPEPRDGGQRARIRREGLTSTERAVIVTLHNQCRGAVRPPATPALRPLVWSEESAAIAQRWASQCRYAHNHARGRRGENIAYGTRGSIDQLVQLWIAEAGDYAYTADRCKGSACGHYTQMVWRGSTSVGCGAAMCPFGRYLVCNYTPPGNIVGRRPY